MSPIYPNKPNFVLNLYVPVPDENAVDKLNEILPPAIRVMGTRRVTRGFNPKTKCNARSYAYLMPSFALCRVEDGPITESSRPPKEAVAQFDLLLKRFIGTKKFHNFTARRDMDCPSNHRLGFFPNRIKPLKTVDRTMKK
jgi:tRNA pseudouridine38-40 synthase